MQRPPHPQLAGLIKTAWFSAPAPGGGPRVQAREHVMPTGLMHLVFRLDGPAVRIFKDAADTTGAQLGHALVGGARAGFYAKDMAGTGPAIGMQLLPGAAQALLGLPADELAGRHVRLEDIWGSSAGLMREQLLAAPTPEDKLRTFEALLLRRLAGSSANSVNPAIKRALAQLDAGMRVEEVVLRSGYSHRQFIRLFSQAVGLPPKLYGRVQRFQKALSLMQKMQAARGGAPSIPPSLALVAMEAGYADQPHFNREFREFSGVTPEQYRLARPESANHVAVAARA
ncbi:AraC-type DNA-binding protein [Polaromonas sp. YR568]|uniref:helix-turn-helix domain-containing protein n=1 Tax=Polaromonas sp. YR568 TaxID=1855301 RepID=UPI0008DFAED5|nr:AraC family transcriptional regulator [Polaromonas sp. YR568]SFV03367.1 AraC-type DNA-binding protein [Polaromonas sp. YR568]